MKITMKRNFGIWAIAVALISVSCNKAIDANISEEKENEPESGEMVQVEIEAGTDDKATESKVAVNGTVTSWEIGDKASVFVRPKSGSLYPAYPFTVSRLVDGNGKHAILAGKVPEGAKPFVSAIVPQDPNAISDWNGHIKNYTIPTIQNGKFSNVVFYGAPGNQTADSEKNKKFTFSAVSGIVKLTVPAGLRVKAIKLISENTNLNLAGTITFNADGTTSVSKSTNTITVLADEGETLSGDIYVAVLPQQTSTYTDMKLKMYVVNTDMKYASFSNGSMKRFVKGTIENLGEVPATTTFPYDAKAISVSKDKKIFFSPGLLQYQPSSKTWKFAQDQLTIIGNNPGNSTYASSKLDESNRANMEDWIDLFPYGHSCDKYPPYECLNVNAYYFSHSEGVKNLTGETYGKYDWGANKIKNGDNEDNPYTWRLLTAEEFKYLAGIDVTGRSTTVEDRFCRVVIDGTIRGVLLFPDVFIWPFDKPNLNPNPFNYRYGNWTSNPWNITMEQFYALQAVGTVFLPITGYRPGPVDDEGRFEIRFDTPDGPVVHYWTSTGAGAIWISNGNVGADDQAMGSVARAVRLVKEVE